MSIISSPGNLYKDVGETLELSSIKKFIESVMILKIVRKVRKYTKIRIPRLKVLYRLVKDLDEKSVEGDIAEFGVWKGGSAAVLAKASEHSPFHRKMWMFESFQGNPEPAIEDGEIYNKKYHKNWSMAKPEDVKKIFAKCSIPKERYQIIEGWFQESFPAIQPLKLSLIHFDAETYEAAKLCLEKFYDFLSPNGYIVFNSWKVRDGVRKAMNEFLKERNLQLRRTFFDNEIGCYFQKTQPLRGMDKPFFENFKYDTKRRFISYWHQIHETLAHCHKKVLEIGVGNRFVSNYLKKEGIDVTTCDNNPKLEPDYTANITELPFPDKSYDTVLAYEILEHLPYKKSISGIKELYRVSSRWVIISIPDATRVYRLEIPWPRYGKIKKLFIIPKRTPPKHTFDVNGHYWEIGKKDYPLARIEKDLRNIGFEIKKTYRIFEFPYHRFFILKKK